MAPWLRVVLATVVGYLIGSISPAYILGRLLRNIDIRTVNYRNAGARNVHHTLGPLPAALTALIDTTKGIGAVLASFALFGVGGYVLIGPAVGAVLGHIFPFYLRFRGGRGIATAVGLYLYVCVSDIVAGELSFLVLAGLLVCAALVFLASRSGDAAALFAFLAMVIVSLADLMPRPGGVIALVVSTYAFVHAVFRGRDVGLYSLPGKDSFLGWRVVSRPLAMLFVPLHLVMPKTWFLALLSALAGAALALDAFRMVSKRRMERIYREKEARQLSSITLFLVSTLMLFVLFKPTTAYLALGFLVIGDLSGKVMGLRFGKRELLAGRTLEGSIGFLVGAVIAGYALARGFGEPPVLIMLGGAASAAVIELLTMGIDDNLTVGLGSAGVVTLLLLI